MNLVEFLQESVEEERAWSNLMLEGVLNENAILFNEELPVAQKAEKMGENKENIGKKAIEMLKEALRKLTEWVANTVKPFASKISELKGKVKEGGARALLQEALGLVSKIGAKLQEAKAAVSRATSNVRDMGAARASKEAFNKAKSEMVNLFQKMQQLVREAKAKASKVVDDAKMKSYAKDNSRRVYNQDGSKAK